MGFLILFAFAFSFAITPMVQWFAIRIGAVDQPNERKVHRKSMARMGGLSFVLSFWMMIGIGMGNDYALPDWILPFFMGSLIMVLTGMLDDRYGLTPRVKLLGQFTAALVVVISGFRMEYIHLPFFDHSISLGWMSIPLTIAWILAITNAVNLIDGLDGLASGISVIALGTIATLAWLNQQHDMILISLIFMGSIMGFWVHNRHPAKLFMGDTGSLFLGYSLSIFALAGFKSAVATSIGVPLLILAVPILDTVFAMIRRVLNQRPITAPDKHHLHHRLLAMGLGHAKTVHIIHAIALVFGICAIVFSELESIWMKILFFFVLAVVVEIWSERIGIYDGYRPLLARWRMMRIWMGKQKKIRT